MATWGQEASQEEDLETSSTNGAATSQKVVDLATMLFWRQSRFTRWALSQVTHWGKPYTISLQQMVIMHLVRTEGLTLAQLARRLLVAPTVVTGVVDRIEHQHLIRRQAHDSDRRIKQLVLTTRGEELERHLEHEAVTAVAQSLEMFSAEERETLAAYVTLLDRLTKQLLAAGDAAPAGVTIQRGASRRNLNGRLQAES